MEPLPSAWPVLDSPGEVVGADDPAGRTRDLAPILGVAAAVVAALVLALVIGVGNGGGEREVVVPIASSSLQPDQGDTDAEIVVEVSGAVRQPGLVRLPRDSRVADAIAAAGGYAPTVDTDAARALHLARPLADGDQVRVPARGDPAAEVGGSVGTPDGSAAPIDLNTATAEQLDTLPGVGPATAKKIIDARTERPFASLDDLRDRKVLGPATLDRIKDLIVVR
jgi:competence protein ComEA